MAWGLCVLRLNAPRFPRTLARSFQLTVLMASSALISVSSEHFERRFLRDELRSGGFGDDYWFRLLLSR